MQLTPTPALAPIIRHFLVLENEAPGALQHRLFPDGSAAIVFHYGQPFKLAAFNTLQPGSFVYGQISTFHNMITTGRIGMIVVVLQPWATGTVFHIPAHEMTDRILDTRQLWGHDAALLEEQIMEAGDAPARIQLLEKFLLTRYAQLLPSPDIIKTATSTIHARHGSISVQQLAAQVYISPRQLERIFREHTGISPGHYAGIIKLQHALKLLRQQPASQRLIDIVYESGYFDQAHFIRTFKKTTGITPGQYFSHICPLAVNFLQYSGQ